MTQINNSLVKLENVGVFANDKWLVKGVTFEINKGQIVTLIGPNGSGKTTTAKITLGLYKDIEGKVQKFTEKIAYVPQRINIDWTLPIRVNDFMNLTNTLTNDEIKYAVDLHVVMSKTDHVVCLNGHVCCSGTPIDVANNEKYQEIFGKDISKILSVYEHTHDHVHNIDGSIEKKK